MEDERLNTSQQNLSWKGRVLDLNTFQLQYPSVTMARLGSATSVVTPSLQRRFDLTLRFVKESLDPPARLLDLGAENTLGKQFAGAGYSVAYSGEADLDEHPELSAQPADAVTAFEVLEHLVNPLGVLRQVEAPRLFATVPLRLWFAKAYRNPVDPWDRHYHEFESWQFDWLLEKAGWRIVRREAWTSPPDRLAIGLRPVLRRFTPRHYAVEAVRTDSEAFSA